MSPERPGAAWAAVNALFHRALEQPPEVRRSFVAREAGSDTALRDEVLDLVSSHDRAAAFLDAGAVDAEALMSAVTRDPLVGRSVGHYHIERVLGAGGMGIVYLARDAKLGRPVALKSLPPEFLHDRRRRERLSQEARAAATLAHPGIATVYALEEIDGRVLIASEFIAGRTLRDELADGPLAFADALATAIDVARALQAAHVRGVVHRDLKPENIMRTESGTVKILDFGLAQALQPSDGGSSLTTEGSILGTPAYMAPEQVRGGPVAFTADIFAFGVVLYELVTGENPFAGSNPASSISRILELTPPPLAGRVPGSAASASHVGDLGAIVDRCLQKHPSNRFQATSALVTALEQVARGEPRTEARAAWWWSFHQTLACVAYAGLLPALWVGDERIGGAWGIALFLAALVAAIVSVTLRLHLWFAVRSYPQERERQRLASAGWRRAGDAIFSLTLAASGLWLLQSSRALGLVLVGAAVVVFLAFAVIEPATERAAFQPSAPGS